MDDLALVRDKNVVAVIAFRESSIYPTDAAPGERPERIVATDPRGRFHKVHHHAGNPSGTYEDDSPEYWRELTEALSPAGAILLLGHGKGKANASHHWVAYVEKHDHVVAAKVVADVRVDIDHLDENQVLRLAQHYFATPSLTPRTPPMDLNNHHRDTLEQIFSHPSSANIEWREVLSLLGTLGSAAEEHNGKFKITIGSNTEIFPQPRDKDIDQQMIVDLRRLLTEAGFAPQHPTAAA